MAQQKAVEPEIDEVEDLVDELQPGAKLLKGQYTITRYLNSGGFGITYLAKDSLDRDIVIKECFPSSVCRRSKVVVAARSRAHTAELRSIVQLFVREARNLAKIVHPNIVAVHQVFEDNGTAYMAIDYVDGLDLQQIIDGEGRRPTPAEIVHITDKLLVAVGFIHANDMLHRDISPDNVLINQSGEPILIDFGAAREQASKSNRTMSALRVVKDGYSPQEFYIAGSEQGPWSDLYALGATLYHLISDVAPINGQARLAALAEDRADPYVPLKGRFPSYPKGFLEAIDLAMSTMPKQRVQSATDWLALYHGNPVSLAAPVQVEDAVQRILKDDSQRIAPPAGPSIGTPPPLAKPALYTTSVPPASRGRSPVQLFAGVAAALAVVVGGYVMLGSGEAPAPAETASVADAGTGTDTSPVLDTSKPAETTAAVVTPEPAPTETAVTALEAPVAAPVVETAATEPVAPIEVAPTEAEPEVLETPAPEPAAVETATAEPEAIEPAAEEPAVDELAAAEVPAAEPAVVEAAPVAEEPAAEVAEVVAPVVPTGKPAENQIALAAWDIDLPFQFDRREIDGQKAALVTRIPETADLSVVGDWLAPGIIIYAVNSTPIEASGSLTVAILNAMTIDPDGKARVVVEYSDASRERKTGLLTVAAVRLVNLQNGVTTETAVVDGVWRTTVTAVLIPEMTTLQQGDQLFRDKTTGAALDDSRSFEAIMTELVAKETIQTDFAIIRANKVGDARMQLVAESEQ